MYRVYYEQNGEIKSLKTSTLDNLGLENIIKYEKIKTKKLKDLRFFDTLSQNDLLNIFIQLNMIISSGVKLQEAVAIVLNSVKKESEKEFLKLFEKALNEGKPIYKLLGKKNKNIDSAIISMLKILEERGDILIVFESLVKILKTKVDSKKSFLQALRYPSMILFTFISSLILIFNFVVPKFESIFAQYKMNLPLSTKILLECKNYLSDYGFITFLSIITIYLIIKILINKNERFSKSIDKIKVLYIPLFSKLTKNYEFYNYFTALEIILISKYEFHSAIENATALIKNKYLLDKIQKINMDLKNGKSITASFEDVELFDDLIISLLNSGEESNKIEFSISKIKDIYSQNFTKSIKDLSSSIEPIFFILISLLVLWIMLAIFTPIWGLSGMLN